MSFAYNDTPTAAIYTLSLHDALPICPSDDLTIWLRCTRVSRRAACLLRVVSAVSWVSALARSRSCMRSKAAARRSEEHTSELQSQSNLVCRLLLEKKKIRLWPVVLSS